MILSPAVPHTKARAGAFVGIALLSVIMAAEGQSPTNTPVSARSAQRSSSTIIRAALGSVVSITVFDSTGTPLGQGSGFLVDSKGTLVTNYHVIKYASSAMAKSANGAFYKVKGVLASDPDNDLAVLRLDGIGFTYLALGNSDTAQVGDRVIAIGSPLGLEASVSDGLVSAIRILDSAPVIQTTAAISPGSSGGALLNTKGEVIGVTTFNVTGGQNLNFAVPAKCIKPLLSAQTIRPFAPIPSPPRQSLETQAKTEPRPEETPQATVPESLPREWIMVEDGNPVTVRLEGDHLYVREEFQGDGSYSKRMEDNCETKRQGNTFVGKCHRRIWLNWLSAFGDNICSVERDEFITSVTAHRIEGESQTLRPPSDQKTCPAPGASNTKFAYIPRY